MLFKLSRRYARCPPIVFLIAIAGLWLQGCAPSRSINRELHQGISENNVAKIENALRHGASLTRPPGSLTPLIDAAIQGHAEAMASLLKAGADPNDCPEYWGCPLEITENHGKLEMVELLLKAGADPNVHYHKSAGPLTLAILNSNPEIASRLLDAGANPLGFGHISPLSAALSNKQPEIAERLMRMGMTPEKNDPALLKAAENCDVMSLRLLRKAEQRLGRAGGWRGPDALELATRHDCTEGVKLLLEAGAGFPFAEIASSSFTTDWFKTIGAANAEILEAFFAAGVDPKATNKDQETFLHLAARRGRADSVKLLIAKGLNVDARNERSHTPLMVAADNQYRQPGTVDVVKTLLEAKANPLLFDQWGKTAKTMAAEQHRSEVLELLEHYGDKTYAGFALPPSRFDSEVIQKTQQDVTASFYEALPFVVPGLRVFAVLEPPPAGYRSINGYPPTVPATLFVVMPEGKVVKLAVTRDFPKLGQKIRSENDAIALVSFLSVPNQAVRNNSISVNFEDIKLVDFPLKSRLCFSVTEKPLRKAGIGEPQASARGAGARQFFEVTRYLVPTKSLRYFKDDRSLDLPWVLRATERVGQDGSYRLITTKKIATPGLIFQKTCFNR
jgi:ankyrin repeat protein